MNLDTDAAKRRQVVEWLNSLFPDLDLPADASPEEVRARLYDGNILCGILNRSTAGSLEIQGGGVFLFSEQRLENVKRFLSAVERLGLPGFNVSDLETGSLAAVVQCLLSLRIHLSSKPRENGIYDPSKMDNQSRRKWDRSENGSDVQQAVGGERRRSVSESKLYHVSRSHVTSGILQAC